MTVLATILSFFIVAFGQPAWNWVLGLIAASCGFAIIWGVLLQFPSRKHRFWIGTLWYAAVLIVQQSWFISHPYLYIYALWIVLSLGFGAQFGIIALLIKPERVQKFSTLFFVPALWTLFEWSRLYILSGYSWNPVGLALTGSVIPLQTASLAGIFGLTFWVFFVNFLALKTWISRFAPKALAIWALAALFPYAYGGAQYLYHSHRMNDDHFSSVLVQTSFPVEEAMTFRNQEEFLKFVLDEWRQILKITQQHQGKQVDLVALPEFVVPFGAYSFVYPYETVKEAFVTYYGQDSLEKLPPLKLPLAYQYDGIWMVNNAYWLQAIANCFDSAIVSGIEDIEVSPEGQRDYYSAALFIQPFENPFNPVRYSKRVLVPMGEYIPFECCRDLAARYGVCGSFTCGEEAVVMNWRGTPFGVSICYEETYGDMMRENREKGAELLLNVTNDGWYPNSRLPQQHLDHSRLRTVENGIPLLRACNTGITTAIDSLGRDVATLGDDETLSDSLYVQVPTYHYQTLYSKFGDGLVVGLSLLISLLYFRRKQ